MQLKCRYVLLKGHPREGGAGAAAGLQAAGLSTNLLPSGAASLADTSTQLAALNAEATQALEAAIAGRASTLSADAAAGLLAAQQVSGHWSA